MKKVKKVSHLILTFSILKNMTLCGLPVPKKLKEHIKEALSDMTDEMPQESKEE